MGLGAAATAEFVPGMGLAAAANAEFVPGGGGGGGGGVREFRPGQEFVPGGGGMRMPPSVYNPYAAEEDGGMGLGMSGAALAPNFVPQQMGGAREFVPGHQFIPDGDPDGEESMMQPIPDEDDESGGDYGYDENGEYVGEDGEYVQDGDYAVQGEEEGWTAVAMTALGDGAQDDGLHTYIHTSLCSKHHKVCMYVCMRVCVYACTYIHMYMHACMHACMHTYIHTYIHTCMHAYIHAYIHTYIHTLWCLEHMLNTCQCPSTVCVCV
jgi:hypothetical protein